MNFDSLPQFEFGFEVDVIGSETKERYKGSFVYCRPKIKEQSEIARLKGRLDGGVDVGLTMVTIHDALARLKITLKEYPKWWEKCDYGMELYDLNVIAELLKHINDFEDQFIEKISDKQPKEKKKEGKEEKTDEQSDT